MTQTSDPGPHGLPAPHLTPASAQAPSSARRGDAPSRAVGLAIDLAKSVLIAALVFAVACGAVGVFLTTSVGRELIGGLKAQDAGPYEIIFREVGSVLGPLCSFALLGSLFVFAQRRKAGLRTSVKKPLIVGLVLAGASWGYMLYAGNTAMAAEDREYAAATGVVDRQSAELAALFAEYQKVQASAHLEGVVELGTAASKDAIAQAEKRLAAMGRAVTALQTGFDEAHARFRHEIEALDILDSHKRAMLTGFDTSVRKRANRVRAYCAAERALIAAGEQLVAFAATRPAAAHGPTPELERLQDRWRAAAEKEQKLAAELQAAR